MFQVMQEEEEEDDALGHRAGVAVLWRPMTTMGWMVALIIMTSTAPYYINNDTCSLRGAATIVIWVKMPATRQQGWRCVLAEGDVPVINALGCNFFECRG